MTISNLASGAAKKLNRHAPTILTALSVVGVAATSALLVRAGILAERDIQHEQRVNEKYDDRPPTVQEKIAHTWHHFLIPTSIGVATVVCIISTNALNQKRQASLIGAYALAERGISHYRDKVREMVGEHGEGVIRHEATKDMAAERVIDPEIYDPEKIWFVDTFSGQIFDSDEETIYHALDAVHIRAEEDGWVSLNYFYDLIGARTSELGEHMGWSDGHQPSITLTKVTFKDGTHGFGIEYSRYPFVGYFEV